MIQKNNLSMFLGLCMLVVLSGCCSKKNGKKNKKATNKNATISQVDIPLADNSESIRSFFDSDLKDFVAIEDSNLNNEAQNNQATAQNNAADLSNDFTRMQNNAVADNDMKKIYFEFDKYDVVNEHQSVELTNNINQVKAVLAHADKTGTQAIFAVEGHACDSAGSDVYNVALSQKRAKTIADYLVNNGVSRENIKIVGRGSEMPEIVDGKPVKGNREEQWINRRSEIHILYS